MRGQTVFPFFQPPVGWRRAAAREAVGRRGAAARVARRASDAREAERGRLNAQIAPRMAPAALRVPNPVHAPQIALTFPKSHPQIFVHEDTRQVLERRLRAAFPDPVVLAVTDNRHSMVTYVRRGGILRARLHMMFLDAEPAVQEALVRYIVRGDREASQMVERYIDANGHRIRATRPVLTPLYTKGQHHDLLALF